MRDTTLNRYCNWIRKEAVPNPIKYNPQIIPEWESILPLKWVNMPKATIHMEMSNIIKPFYFLNLKMNKPKKTAATTDTNEHKEVILVVNFSDSFTATINAAYR